jgi:sterol desaturase/sphingolipid hydroxylase (fatty acid hydroxylase superfamily)
MSAGVVEPTRAPTLGVVERATRTARHLRSALSARIYLPACVVAVVAGVLLWVGWASGWGDADFAGSVVSLRAVVAGPATLAIIGVFLVVERTWPAQSRPLLARGHRHDMLFTLVNALLVVPLVTALTLATVHVARSSVPWIVLPRIGLVPRWAAIAVIVVAMDGLNWAVHLANHRFRMLWRFHELHHSQEDMSVLTVFRTHPLIHVSYLVALLPGVVLVANGVMSITVLVVYGAIVAFAHSNTRLGFGPLERIFVSPNYHRIHHMVDGPQDVNVGFALTIWDQLFHRAVFPTEDTIRADTGLPGRPLIVEQEARRARHLSVFAAQMVAPFRPMRIATDLPPVRSSTSEPTHPDADAPAGERLSRHRDERAAAEEHEVARW